MNAMDLPMLTIAESWLHSVWFRSAPSSVQAAETDSLFMFIMWTCIISFALLLSLIVYFPIKYRRSKQSTNYVQSPSHNTLLELTWSVLPLLLMAYMFVEGFKGYFAKLAAPTSAEEIQILGQMWSWTPTYRNGAGTDMTCQVTETKTDVPVIYVPAGRPVKLIMTSRDVIHAFYIPDFRTKMDVFPNRYTSMWFQPLEPTNSVDGKYFDDKGRPLPGVNGHYVFCAEYCGTKHSEMAGYIIVLPEKEYEKKVYQLATAVPTGTCAEVGQIIAKRKGCFQCHSIDGSKNSGPTWQGMYGQTHKYTNGETQVVDENSLRENILYSQKRILEGYAGQNMPVFAGQINDVELYALICYIKTLNPTTPQAELDQANEQLDPEKVKKK